MKIHDDLAATVRPARGSRYRRAGGLPGRAGTPIDVLEPRRMFNTYTVTDGNDNGPGSLRSAVTAALAAGGQQTVLVTTTQTIGLNSPLQIGTGASLTIASQPAERGTLTTVDFPNGGGGEAILFEAGATAVVSGLSIGGNDAGGDGSATVVDDGTSVTLDDDTIEEQGSTGSAGGCSALAQNGGQLAVNNCTFTGGAEAVAGGGIVDTKGTLTVTESTFSTQCGNGTGGGIYNAGGTVGVADSTFTAQCGAVEAGAVDNTDGGTLDMTDCVVRSNAAEQAGGIENDAGSTATVRYTTVQGCTAGDAAAAVWNLGTFTGTQDTFADDVDADGAGAFQNQAGTTRLTDCTFTGNETDDGTGGALLSTGGTLSMYDCTVTGNQVEGPAGNSGGLTLDAATKATVDDTIVANNVDLGGGTAFTADVHGTVTSGADDLIGTGGSGGLANGVDGNVVGVKTADLHLAPLAYNGGPTETIAPQAGSPALSAGSGLLADEAGVTEDERGFHLPSSGAIDVGAYDTQPGGADGPTQVDVQFATAGAAAQTGAAAVGAAGDAWSQPVPAYAAGVGSPAVGTVHGAEQVILPAGEYTSTVRAAFRASGAYDAGTASPFAGTPLKNLMESYLVSYGQSDVALTGLVPDTAYDLYLYSAADGAANGRQSVFTVGDPDGTDGALTDTATATATFNSGDKTLVAGVNYVEVAATADAEGRLTVAFAAGSGSTEADLNGIQIQVPAVRLTGTTYGTPGSYDNDGDTIAKATDGNLSTFYDAATASGGAVGIDLGSAQVVSQIAFAPRSGYASRMVGGYFQASNNVNFTSGVVTAYTVTAAPASGVLTTVSTGLTTAYRYWRYVGPAGGYCNIAEFQLFGT